jgi:soluble P-type ATPase
MRIASSARSPLSVGSLAPIIIPGITISRTRHPLKTLAGIVRMGEVSGPAVITFDIPGFAQVRLEHLVLDFNGTLARDGTLLPGVRELIASLAESLQVHVVTADTFGRAAAELGGLPLKLTVLAAGDDQAQAKLDYVKALGAAGVVAVGNGRNDRLMLHAAEISMAVIQREGAAAATVCAADIVATSIRDALELLTNAGRLTATLRS